MNMQLRHLIAKCRDVDLVASVILFKTSEVSLTRYVKLAKAESGSSCNSVVSGISGTKIIQGNLASSINSDLAALDDSQKMTVLGELRMELKIRH